MKQTIFAFLMLGILFQAAAEVYWPGPRRKSGTPAESLLPGLEKTVYSQNITVNGKTARLALSVINGTFAEIVPLLKRTLKPGQYLLGRDTMRFIRPVSDKTEERFLLISSGREKNLVCFRIRVPKKLPPPSHWPEQLPTLPGGARATMVMNLATGGICGEFDQAGGAAYQNFRATDAELRGRGYTAGGNEIANSRGGTGDLYFKSDAIIWVTYNANGQGIFFWRKR